MDRNNLEIAALLHDIGKFYQRSIEDYKDTFHGMCSSLFVKDHYHNEDIGDLVLNHHNPISELGKIVQKADSHSAYERVELSYDKETSKTPLTSIFSRIALSNDLPNEMYVPLKSLSLENGFESLKPQKRAAFNEDLTDDYRNLWDSFIKEFGKIHNKYDFSTILAILRKYASTIPSAVYKSDADISLYDHAKTTAALAVCRYEFNKVNVLEDNDTQKVYLTITGDISGIQNFIYKISSPADAQSGMSRRLRGRSIYISLLNQAIADKIVYELDLTEANILFCGGGRFTIVAPNTVEVKEKLAFIKKEVNKHLIDKFNAELYLALEYIECSGEDLGNFGGITKQISHLLNEDKKHKFYSNLREVFEIEKDVDYVKTCSVCGNPLKHNNHNTCDECHSHEDIGRVVANRDYIIKYVSNRKIGKSVFFDALNIGFAFRNDDEKLANEIEYYSDNAEKVFVLRLNSTDFLDYAKEYKQSNVSFSFSFLGNTIPQSNKFPLYFEHLAQASTGASKLGVLKMDVDNLGKLFSKGFDKIVSEDNKNYENKKKPNASISRVSSLSSFMDLFFSGIINEIAQKYRIFADIPEDQKDKFIESGEFNFDQDDSKFIDSITFYKEKPDAELSEELLKYAITTIHINYSGGDDLLVLGPYDDIVAFAGDFRDKFKQWTCNNPDINISGGINIVNPKFPIGKAVAIADANLEKSKSCGKDKITLFSETVDWKINDPYKGFDELLVYAKKLENYQINDELSSGFVYSLLKLWYQYIYNGISPSSEEELSDINRKRCCKRSFVPQLKYKLRTISDKNIRDEIDRETITFMPWIKIPVSLASLRMR